MKEPAITLIEHWVFKEEMSRKTPPLIDKYCTCNIPSEEKASSLRIEPTMTIYMDTLCVRRLSDAGPAGRVRC